MEYRNAEFKCYNKYPNYPAVCKLLRPERLCSTAVACTAALHAVERPSRPAKAGKKRERGGQDGPARRLDRVGQQARAAAGSCEGMGRRSAAAMGRRSAG